MILTIEPRRSATPRGREDAPVKTPRLFLAVPSTPAAESTFAWPDWLSPVTDSRSLGAMQLIPLTTAKRSRAK